MKTTLNISGSISAVVNKNFENKKTVYAQFLSESESKGMEIIKVKITVDEDITKLEKNAMVSIPVSVVAVNGNIFYSQTEALKVIRESK